MKNSFEQNVIRELNKFRSNPKSIQHQCELIHKGLSRLRANDPFLKEIESFLKELETIKPLPEVKYNKILSESAKKELPNFRGRTTYQKYKTGKDMKGIVPDAYLEAYPALVADDGADEPINVLTKVLLNKLDTLKEGRAILCDKKFTQVGIAHEEFEEENMVILIFATRYIDDEPIKSTKSDFLMNIQYHETKDIKRPKFQAKVHHRIRGEIFGGENFVRTKNQKAIYSQGPNRPKLGLNDYQPVLRGNKSVKVMNQYSSRTAAPARPKGNIQNITTAKKEKVQETSSRRRNEGTTTKTQTKTEKTTTKTTTTTRTNTSVTNTRGKPKETTYSTTTTTTEQKSGNEFKDLDIRKIINMSNLPETLGSIDIDKKANQATTTTSTSTQQIRARGNDNTDKNEPKGNEPKETTTENKYVRRFRRGQNNDSTPSKIESKTDNKTENKNIIISITKVEETDNNNKDDKVLSTETKTNKRFRKGNNDIVNKTETKVVEITMTKVEEIGNDKGETFTETKITKKSKGGDNESEKTEIKTETKVEEKVEAQPASAGPSIRRKYARKKKF